MKDAQRQRPHTVWVHFYQIFRTGEFIKTESRLVIVRDWEEGAITQEESSSHSQTETLNKQHMDESSFGRMLETS